MNSLKTELEQHRLALITESSSYDVSKKCDDIKFVMNEWFNRLQKRGDKEAYVDSMDALSKKISILKQEIKSDVDLGNSILYVPDNARLLSVVNTGISKIVDEMNSYMKDTLKFYDMTTDETDRYLRKQEKIESMMDDFDSNVDNCFVTKKPVSISGYLVITDELLDSIDSIMNHGIVDDLLDATASYAKKYMISLDDEFTKRDFSNIESMFKLVRSFFGSLRIYIGKSYGSICTNVQKIREFTEN